MKKRGLGRGLNALFEDEEVSVSSSASAAASGENAPASLGAKKVGIDQLEPGPWQPRQDFDQGALKELADSIRQHGVLQPLLVRAKPGHDNRYQIIAGERRWRASQKAQLHEVPVVIKELSDEAACEIALIENLQRADLNAIEEAQGYQRLMSEFGHTQEKLASGLGKSRSHVANIVRLLSLPSEVQNYVRDGRLSAGHARALVTAQNAEVLAQYIMEGGLSVRETERLVAGDKTQPEAKGGKAKPAAKDVDTVALEKEMSDMLGFKVTIDVKSDGQGGRWGNLRVDFKSLDQLDEILQRLSSTPRRDIIGG
jgi:ParB family chromosome partitioning protein